MLRNLRRVHIQFSPTDPAATAARELLQRVGCRSARASNPDCKVVINVDESTPAGGAWMELQFTDGETTKLAASGLCSGGSSCCGGLWRWTGGSTE